MLVSALELLRGAKAGADLVRAGATEASVTATFEFKTVSPALQVLLESVDWNPAEPLLVKRVISQEGKSRCYIHHHPVPLQLLKSIGPWLFDIASQHEQQRLLDVATHVDILDTWAGLQTLRATFAEHFARYEHARNDL